jgi:hypothetical protein
MLHDQRTDDFADTGVTACRFDLQRKVRWRWHRRLHPTL